MTIREALNKVFEDLFSDIRDMLELFNNIFVQGRGAELHDKDFKLFLSGVEEQAEYEVEFLGLIDTHKRRGSEEHIINDIERMTNTDLAAALYYPQGSCGWVMGVTSPGFIDDSTYDEDTSLAYLGLDNMLDVAYENGGVRSKGEIEKAVRREFVPAVINVRQNVLHFETKNYVTIVESDGGVVNNVIWLNVQILYAIANGYFDDIEFWTSLDFGTK